MNTIKATETLANGTVIETETTRRALCSKSDYSRSGRMGSYETVYGNVNMVVSHPFQVGDKVCIGNGKVAWTVEYTDTLFVSISKPRVTRFGFRTSTNRTFEYAAIGRLTKAGA